MRLVAPGLWLAAVVAGAPVGLDAQVGHAPERSPYRDVRIKQTVTLFGAYLSGGRGKADVGPSDGYFGGARWDLHIGSAATFFLGFSAASLDRNLIRPLEPPDTRFAGTTAQQVYILDAGLNLTLTGRKTWNGLAPYLGVAFGVALGERIAADSSGFTFKTKFQAGPAIGTRIFFNRRLHLRIEGRDILWRLNYPDAFFQDPDIDNPDVGPVLDPKIPSTNEWTHHLTLMIGLGYTIRI